MEWIKDLASERYTMACGTCLAVVWIASLHRYTGVVHHRDMHEVRPGFRTLHDAQAWCLTRLAELHRQGRCSEQHDTPVTGLE